MIRGRIRCGGSPRLGQGLEDTDCSAVHVTAQEGDASSSIQGVILKFFNESITLRLGNFLVR